VLYKIRALFKPIKRIDHNHLMQQKGDGMDALSTQARYMDWLEELSSRAANLEELCLDVRGIKLNCLDILRSEIKVKGAESINNYHTAQALRATYPQHTLLLDPKSQTSRTLALGRILAHQNPSLVSTVWANSQALPLRLKQRLYREKQYLLRKFADKQDALGKDESQSYCPIIAVPREPAHILDIEAVENVLKKKHGIVVKFIACNSALAGLLMNKDRPIHRLAGTHPYPRSYFRKLQDFVEANAYSIAGFEKDEARAMAQALLGVVKNNLPEILRFAHSFESLFLGQAPKLVMVGNPYTMEGRISTYIAQTRGSLVVAMEHGTIRAQDPNWKNCLLDEVYVWGEPSQRSLLQAGLRKEQIRITGSPRMDSIVKETKQSLTDENPYILVTTSAAGNQVNESEHRRFIEHLFLAVETNPKIQWLVKLHRKDKMSFYERPDGLPSNMKIIRGEYGQQGKDIFHYLRRARALLTVISTSALDAMLVGVPVVTLEVRAQEGQTTNVIEFLEKGCTYKVSDGQELSQTCDALWCKTRDAQKAKIAQEYVEQHYSNLGQAAETIADRIHALSHLS
jgi:hypothetical protein